MQSPRVYGQPEIPCAECGRRFPLAKWGEFCPECLEARRKRATGIARRVALVAVVILGIVLRWSVQLEGNGRIYAVIAVIATYFFARRIAHAVAMEYLPRTASTAATSGESK